MNTHYHKGVTQSSVEKKMTVKAQMERKDQEQ